MRQIRTRREGGELAHVDVYAFDEGSEEMAWIYAGSLEGGNFRPAFSAPSLSDAEIDAARRDAR